MKTMPSTSASSADIAKAAKLIRQADAILIGAGAGLSTAAGFDYSGPRWKDNFGDFIAKYGLKDMYSAGFYPFKTLEERWAFWSRHIWLNRYEEIPGEVYRDLFDIVKSKDYFVLTTNVDHCFQKSGFDKKRLFYTQGDYGLWQCSVPCHAKTYDNRERVKEMLERQRDTRIPAALVPYCPKCGAPMTMNLRIDDTFVEDAGWNKALDRYRAFGNAHARDRIVYFELGVGENTPSVIKYPFWQMTRENQRSSYIYANLETMPPPLPIEKQSLPLTGDIGAILSGIKSSLASQKK